MPWIEFALALCVLVAVAVASDSVTTRLANAQYWVVHTHEVETTTAQTRADFVAAGDARQIFITTGDATALADYNRAKVAIPIELSNLQQMTADNPTQQANIRELRQVVGQRLSLLEQSINLRENSGSDTEQQKQWTRDSVALKDQTLTILDRMKAEEDRLMAVRQTISVRNYRHVRIVLIASFAVVVLLLMINFYHLARELKERNQAERAVQQLSSRILRVQDEERRRVARELHDSIGQVFAVLKMNLEMISRTFTTSDPQQVQQLLTESKTALEMGLSGARTLSHLLHPPLLDEMGFVAAAKWLVEGFSQRSKIQVKLEVAESLPRMEQDIELALFRILQEALTNIHKHSDSPSVDICVKVDGSKVSLRITDYGRGIPASVIDTFKKSQAGLGVGLAGMRERVRDLGGRLELTSDGNGSVVEASVPFSLAPEPQEADALLGGAIPEQHG
ncbi:MAG TPA: CHASE3 domain-containing protein [Candidatus Acidoferrales bacterium]|nr:CHASE3 domain-containing protein [Candidatus Acidoferrales bacterium]